MSAHVSVLDLHQFVTRGESSPHFEQHVNGCASCARKLSDFARRAVSPVPVLTDDAAEPRRLAAFVMAFAACLAVMLVQSIRVPKFDVTPAAPEGNHGVARTDDPRLSESIIFQVTGPTDSGATDSGVR